MNRPIPKHRRTRAAAVVALGAVAALSAAAAWSQTERSGGGASAQALQQLQQLASERTALQAENARLKGELEKLRKERDDLKAGREGVESRSRTAQAALTRSAGETETARNDLARERERMQELVGRLREAAASLRDVETDRAAARQTLVERERDLKLCTQHNATLFQLNEEVLARFDDQGFWGNLARNEPFTRLKRTQLENLADTYRDRATAEKLP